MKRRDSWLAASALGAVVLLLFVLRFRGLSEKPEEAPPPRVPDARQVSEHHWIVRRIALDAYLADRERLNRQVQLRPTLGQDRQSVQQLTLALLDGKTPLFAAGFREGDQIRSVNGTPITTMGRAVNLVHEIKACNRLTVQIQRGDQIIDYQFDFE